MTVAFQQNFTTLNQASCSCLLRSFKKSALSTHASCPGPQVIWGECIAGALYINDFLRIAKEAGFADPRILHQGPVAIHDHDIQVLGAIGRHWMCNLLST